MDSFTVEIYGYFDKDVRVGFDIEMTCFISLRFVFLCLVLHRCMYSMLNVLAFVCRISIFHSNLKCEIPRLSRRIPIDFNYYLVLLFCIQSSV